MVSAFPELKKIISEHYTGWAEGWGLSLAFAITQSLEASETIVSDTLVALIASDEGLQRLARDAREFVPGWPTVSPALVSDDRIDSEAKRKAKTRESSLKLPPTVNRVRFAAAVFEASQTKSFRGYTQDLFFKMNPVTRAVVTLKVHAAFTNGELTAALKLSSQAVEEHIEHARLWFSEGKPWVKTVPSRNECTQWTAETQNVWGHYLAKELDADTERKVQAHLVACTGCRASFLQFKERYASWAVSVPVIQPDRELKNYINEVTSAAFRTHEKRGPSPWPGVWKTLRNDQFQTVAFFVALFLLVKWLLF